MFTTMSKRRDFRQQQRNGESDQQKRSKQLCFVDCPMSHMRKHDLCRQYTPVLLIKQPRKAKAFKLDIHEIKD